MITIALVIILTVIAAVFSNCTREEVSVVGIDNSIPPLDTNRPSVTEKATFAMG